MIDLLAYIIIGIVIILVGTAIYIGRLLYKRRGEKDLENGGKVKGRNLELEPLPDEKEVARGSSKDSQSSLENSSIILLSQGKERKSLPKINSKKNSKSLNKIVKSSPKSLQFSRDGSMNNSRYDSMNGTTINDSMNSSRNGSRKSSIDGLGKSSINGSRKGSMDGLRKSYMNGSRKGSIDGLGKSSVNGSRNGSRKGSIDNSSKKGSMNGSRYSRTDFRINSLFIDIPNEINEIPPPPPPSPLKPRDYSVESFLNMMPSDISDSTYVAHISSTSSPAQSKLELIKAQPTSQGDCPEV